MMLYRTLDAVLPAFRTIFARFDLTERQWRVLRVLWAKDDRSVRDISRLTLISPPSLVGVLDRLVRDGRVIRRPSSQDRRKIHVRLTAKGRRLEARVRPLVDETYARLGPALTPAQWKALYRALDRLAADPFGDG